MGVWRVSFNRRSYSLTICFYNVLSSLSTAQHPIATIILFCIPARTKKSAKEIFCVEIIMQTFWLYRVNIPSLLLRHGKLRCIFHVRLQFESSRRTQDFSLHSIYSRNLSLFALPQGFDECMCTTATRFLAFLISIKTIAQWKESPPFSNKISLHI